MKPKRTLQIAQATIEKFSHDGRGLARINGKTVFIEGALPEEKVSFAYLRKKADYDEGRVLAVHQNSILRVKPRCPHYELCGGCSLQHLSEEAQVTVKQEQLLDLLNRIGHVQPKALLPPLKSDLWHYRSKARLSARYVEKKQAVLVGFREKNNPRYITEISQCPILNKRVDSCLLELRALIGALSNPNMIAQVEIAAGENDVALIFRHLTPITIEDENKFKHFGTDNAFDIYLQPGGLDSVHLLFKANESHANFLSYSLPE